jgi:hypothetical protein
VAERQRPSLLASAAWLGACWAGFTSMGLIGGGGTAGGRGAIAASGIAGRIGALGVGVSGATSLVPRKSLTRVSTSWLIEMLLASQNALSRSYVVRLTLMLRRVCFLAMIPLYAPVVYRQGVPLAWCLLTTR